MPLYSLDVIKSDTGKRDCVFVLAKNKAHAYIIVALAPFTKIVDSWKTSDATYIFAVANNASVYCNLSNPRQNYNAFLPIQEVTKQDRAKKEGYSKANDYLNS